MTADGKRIIATSRSLRMAMEGPYHPRYAVRELMMVSPWLWEFRIREDKALTVLRRGSVEDACASM
jgi:hypothetical protein